MSRYFVIKPRIIEVHWDSENNVHTLRLIEGTNYITPLLFVTPLDWLGVFSRRETADIGGWVRIQRSRYNSARALSFFVTTKKGIWTEHVAEEWPEVDDSEFRYLLKQLRGGADPTDGWQDVDARLAADQGWA